jgi:hypothetical protein
MTATIIPAPSERINWKEQFDHLTDGDDIVIAQHLVKHATAAATSRGYSAPVKREGAFCRVTLVKKKSLTEAEITRAKIKEADEEIAYWKRQKALREQPPSRAQAGARLIAWEYQRKALADKLAALQSIKPATV